MSPPLASPSSPEASDPSPTRTSHPRRRNRSARDTLAARLDELLDDGTGATRVELLALHELLLAVPKPDRVMVWLRNSPCAADYLQRLARGDVDLSHEALHDLPSTRTVAYVRDLLVKAGALPPLDRQVALYQAWTRRQLANVPDPGHVTLLRQFHTWHLLPYLQARATHGPLSANSRHKAADAITEGRRLLTWTADQGLEPAALTQHHLDAWLVEHRRLLGRRFLRWAIGAGHLPRLRLPTRPASHSTPISPAQRLAWIRRVLTDETLNLGTRVAAGLVLITAQPMVRIVALTLDDIRTDPSSGTVSLRLGNPPTPLPTPLAELVVTLTQQRSLISTTNSDSRCLFPGHSPGQHLSAGTMNHRLQALGLSTTPARTASLRHLALQAPAPVIAAALGYDHATTEAARQAAAAPWSRYTGTRR